MEMKIKHVATGRTITLKGFGIVDYQDSVEAKYKEETVYGRMDPITTYQGTTRKISMGINYTKAKKSMDKVKAFCNFLMRLQYPVYSEYTESNALALSQPPLVLVEFTDWIQGSKELSFAGDIKFKPLLCAMSGFAYTPQVGFTPINSPHHSYAAGKSETTPTTITMKFNLTVLHDEQVGFNNTGVWTGGDTWGPGDINEAFTENSTQAKFNEASISQDSTTPTDEDSVRDQDAALAQKSGVPGTR